MIFASKSRVTELQTRLAMHEQYCSERWDKMHEATAEREKAASESLLHSKIDALGDQTAGRFKEIDRAVMSVQWWVIAALFSFVGIAAVGAFWLADKLQGVAKGSSML
jgi:hypothetical protein